VGVVVVVVVVAISSEPAIKPVSEPHVFFLFSTFGESTSGIFDNLVTFLDEFNKRFVNFLSKIRRNPEDILDT
jgi:hypothetical protein